MKRLAASLLLACGFCVLPCAAQQSTEHIMFAPSELVWRDLPSLPGVKIAVLEGPLDQPGPIMFRLKFPANYQIPPHWHPGIEHITILSGKLHMGFGDVFDRAKSHALVPGAAAIMQPRTHHFAWTSEETITQIHSIGPWSVIYVNPADDPTIKR